MDYPEVQESEMIKLFVASEKVPGITSDACTGTSFKMDAYAVRELWSSREWMPFYNVINGFEHSEGTEYCLQLKKERLYDPRMSVMYWDEYTLVKIISEEKKDSQNLPDTFIPN